MSAGDGAVSRRWRAMRRVVLTGLDRLHAGVYGAATL